MRTGWKSLIDRHAGDDTITGQRLTLPAALEDGRIPGALGHLSYFASALILAALIWGSIAQIRELAITHGQVIPSSSVKLVHHLEGGIVEDVLAKEGQIVEQNAPLLHLRPTAAKSDLRQAHVRAAHLTLQKIRFSAHISGQTPDFGELGKRYPKLAEDELDVFLATQKQLEKEIHILHTRITQREVELEAALKEFESLSRQVDIQKEKLEIRERLLKEGYTSRRGYLEAKSEFESARARAISAEGRLEATREQLTEAKSQLPKFKAEAHSKTSEDRAKVAAELAELEQSLYKHQDRVDRLQIRAPVRGIVQELIPRTKNEVVKPGELVAKVVPLDEDVVAEVQVQPKDIGHVNVGDEAELKISTYDPNIYGVVKGTVEKLSATTFQKENGEPYYKATIKIDKNHVGSGKTKKLILPGMVVQADIITGAKSLVRYLLKPVYRSLNAAFTER